ncbi:MAG: hypothetical protein M5U28_53740 [Sandaracinaceae bacterium]|nr:hypothetical protein [Sandaracinaceae bacterium]
MRWAWLALAVAACGGAPAGDRGRLGGETGGHARPSPEEHLFGLTDEALPELAPIWPALSARAATELVETLRVEEGRATHCVQIVVAGDLALEARAEWRRGAEQAAYACEEGQGEVSCAAEGATLRIVEDGGPDEAEPALEALAAEMGVETQPSSAAVACVEGLGPSRLATIDERLHLAGLLEPWLPLHEQLGGWRLLELRWSRGERGDEVAVRYRGDGEAFELATEWARASGLAGDGRVWQRVGSPLSLALELRDAEAPELELTLTRDP